MTKHMNKNEMKMESMEIKAIKQIQSTNKNFNSM